MNSDGWTTVRRGRGVPFPDAAASAFGSRRSGGNSSSGMTDGRAQRPRGFDSNATEAFGRKQQNRRDYAYERRAAPVHKPEPKLEISNTELFPALGASASAGAGAPTPKAESGWSSSSFASVMKERAEADKREEEALALARQRELYAKERELADLVMCRRSHRSYRNAQYSTGPPDIEEETYYHEDDENSLDYRHPYDTSYHGEYSAPAHDYEEDETDDDEHTGEDNSAW